MPTIPNARVLIVATDGFEEWELFGPRQILQQRGADVVLASLKRDPIQATVHDDPGKTIRPDLVDRSGECRRFRRADPARRRPQSGSAAASRQRRRADPRASPSRASRSAQFATGRGCWSKPICSRPHGDQLALDPHGPQERRRQRRRRGGGD